MSRQPSQATPAALAAILLAAVALAGCASEALDPHPFQQYVTPSGGDQIQLQAIMDYPVAELDDAAEWPVAHVWTKQQQSLEAGRTNHHPATSLAYRFSLPNAHLLGDYEVSWHVREVVPEDGGYVYEDTITKLPGNESLRFPSSSMVITITPFLHHRGEEIPFVPLTVSRSLAIELTGTVELEDELSLDPGLERHEISLVVATSGHQHMVLSTESARTADVGGFVVGTHDAVLLHSDGLWQGGYHSQPQPTIWQIGSCESCLPSSEPFSYTAWLCLDHHNVAYEAAGDLQTYTPDCKQRFDAVPEL